MAKKEGINSETSDLPPIDCLALRPLVTGPRRLHPQTRVSDLEPAERSSLIALPPDKVEKSHQPGGGLLVAAEEPVTPRMVAELNRRKIYDLWIENCGGS